MKKIVVNEHSREEDIMAYNGFAIDQYLDAEAVTKQLASSRTTKTGIFNAYLNAQRMGLDCSLNELIYKHLDKVTLQDIVNFEKAQMANKPYRYVILGDEKELDMEALGKIGPVKRLTTEEVFGY